MKSLLMFALYFMSGPVKCTDVIGYSGGSVIVHSNMNWYTRDSKFICKMKGHDCSDIIRVDTKDFQVQDGRFMLYSNTKNNFLVLIRKLKPQDAGTYTFGLGSQINSTVNLKVHNNASFGLLKIMTAFLGQNVTITCNYPGEYKKAYKYVITLDDDNFITDVLNTNTNSQNGRFSVSDDETVLRMNISDVTKTDEVCYLFGVQFVDGAVKYFSFFIEIQLHITGSSPSNRPTTTRSNTMTGISSRLCFSSSVIVRVCVCVALLLIGVFALIIYKLQHKKTQVTEYASSPKIEDNKPVTSDRNTDSAHLYGNMKMTSI